VANEETIAVFEAGFPILKKIIVTGSAAGLSKSADLLSLEGDAACSLQNAAQPNR
jgi:hypothetical protein